MKKEKILVVEDESIVAMDIQMGLRKLGYELPYIVDNGADAIMRAREIRPDLVLMDIRIKGDIDGIETARRIWDELKVPVIFLTAYADDKTLARAKLSEPYGYLLKPFEETELHTAIEVALKKHRSVLEREIIQKKALWESEERFRMLIESVQDYAIFMTDPAGNVHTWNQGAEKIYGYSSAEILGRHISLFFSDEDNAKGRPEYALRQSSEKGRYQEEGWRVRKDGTRFWADATITALSPGAHGTEGHAIIVRDLSERQAAERALQNSRGLLQSIIDFSPLVIYIKDADGRFIQVNENFADLVEVPKKEIIGRSDSSFKGVERLSKFLVDDDKVIKEKAPVQIDELSIKDGMPHYFMSIKFPLLDNENRAYALCAIASDITSRKLAEEKMERLLKELKVALKVRDEFISIASHELKTPLTSIILQTQLFERNILGHRRLDNNDIMKFLLLLKKQNERLKRLINDMLDVSRINTGKFEIHSKTVDIGELLGHIVDENKDMFTSRGQDLRLMVDDDIEGPVDEMRLEQVVENILVNASKYAPNSPIEIRAKKSSENKYRIEIADHGPGIAKDKLEKIFTRFERAVSSSYISGLGLGLYISRQIVEAHHGKIWAESEPGKGAKFIIELPLGQVTERPKIHRHLPPQGPEEATFR